MSHTPFILGSYAVGTVIMLWTAIAPVINKRGLLKQLKIRESRMDTNK